MSLQMDRHILTEPLSAQTRMVPEMRDWGTQTVCWISCRCPVRSLKSNPNDTQLQTSHPQAIFKTGHSQKTPQKTRSHVVFWALGQRGCHELRVPNQHWPRDRLQRKPPCRRGPKNHTEYPEKKIPSWPSRSVVRTLVAWLFCHWRLPSKKIPYRVKVDGTTRFQVSMTSLKPKLFF